MRLAPKILFWDIETTDLNADFGTVLVFGYKWLGGKTKTINILDTKEGKKDILDDSGVLREAEKILNEADAHVFHYGMYFDFPFVQTKLIVHKLPLLSPYIKQIDTWWIAKKQMKLTSNRLVALCEALGLETKMQTNKLLWKKARTGDKKSIRYLTKYCKQDVELLNQCYDRLLPLIKNHPNHNLWRGDGVECCTHCGSTEFSKKGFRYTPTSKIQTYLCHSAQCGKRFSDRKAVKRVVMRAVI